jgi:hypothetical protein
MAIELIPDTELVQERDISFNETAALSKETEERLLVPRYALRLGAASVAPPCRRAHALNPTTCSDLANA